MNKKIWITVLAIMGVVLCLAGCSSPYEVEQADGSKIFISNDNLYQITAPGDWRRDQNTIINGATIAATTKDGESQCLYVKPDEIKYDAETGAPTLTLEDYTNDLLNTIEEATANYTELSHETIELAGNPTIAVKIRHTVGEYDTISWLYCMELPDQFLRINAFTYHPDVEANSTAIEQALSSFAMVPQVEEGSEENAE